MRVACVYLPGFPLQVAVASAAVPGWAFAEPALPSPRPVAVLSPGPHPLGGARVLACSKSAHALGVGPGMTAAAARAIAPELQLHPADPSRWSYVLAELKSRLLELSTAVVSAPWHGVDVVRDQREGERGASRSLFLVVPRARRSEPFAKQLLTAIEDAGYVARVAIASDPFTAWAAARSGDQPVTVVARDGSAQLLAPLPLSYLPLPEAVYAVLWTQGVRTLGQFAALPPPSSGSNRPGTLDYRALARGEGASHIGTDWTNPRAARTQPPAAGQPSQRSARTQANTQAHANANAPARRSPGKRSPRNPRQLTLAAAR